MQLKWKVLSNHKYECFHLKRGLFLCESEELSKKYIYLQAFCIFCWNKGIHHTGHGTVYVVINDSWIKEYRALVQGNGATGASLRLICSCRGLFCMSALKLFGYTVKVSPYLSTVTQPISTLALTNWVIDLQTSPSLLRLCRFQLHVME